MRYVKQCLADCLVQHNKTCNRVMWPSKEYEASNTNNIVHGDHGLVVAPTRLVYVGSRNPGDTAKIVDGRECLHKGGHLVLSYCWGATPKDAPWLLRKSTMQRFAAEIPLNDLPQTLHDAIMWARKLGEHYIWIDSMCIIQDDKDDWQREASRMASIYGSATMTIVAASSSVFGGMTDRQNPLRSSVASLELSDGTLKRTVYLVPNGQRPSQVPLSPTDLRAWCYQEDLLSSRLVKLSQTQILWQCMGDHHNPRITAARAQGLEELRKQPLYRWYTHWYQYIEHYTNKGLTYPADKLVAFYGIANAKSDPGYFAGCMKTDPWASLLWCRDENQIRRRPGQRYAEYVAPSWSWAGIDAPVLFYEAHGRQFRSDKMEPTQYDPELLSADAQAASHFDTGAVKGGSVELLAHISLAVTVSVEPFIFNTRQDAHTYGRRNLRDVLSKEIVGMIVFDVACEAQDGMVLWCALLHTVNIGLWEKNGTAGLGLALKLLPQRREQAAYARVGYVQLTSAFVKKSYRLRLRIE